MKLRGKSIDPHREINFKETDEKVQLRSVRGESTSVKGVEAELAATTIVNIFNQRNLSGGKVQNNNEAI